MRAIASALIGLFLAGTAGEAPQEACAGSNSFARPIFSRLFVPSEVAFTDRGASVSALVSCMRPAPRNVVGKTHPTVPHGARHVP